MFIHNCISEIFQQVIKFALTDITKMKNRIESRKLQIKF
jgi:hypothetical protein